MNWLDGLAATLASSPLLAVAVGSLVCMALLLVIFAMAGAPLPRLWPGRRKDDPLGWDDTRPMDMQWNVPHRGGIPLAIKEAEPPIVKNLGDSTLYVEMHGHTYAVPPMPAKKKECCGACDGSRCGDKSPLSASTMTPQELRTALARTAAASQRRTSQAPPRRNPGHVPPRAWPAPASSTSTTRRRDDSSDAGVPFISSRSMDSDPPAPAPKVAPIVSGLGGDFGGAGASSSWAAPAPDTCRAPSPSYDSGSSSSSSSSDCGGGDSGGGGGGGD